MDDGQEGLGHRRLYALYRLVRVNLPHSPEMSKFRPGPGTRSSPVLSSRIFRVALALSQSRVPTGVSHVGRTLCTRLHEGCDTPFDDVGNARVLEPPDRVPEGRRRIRLSPVSTCGPRGISRLCLHCKGVSLGLSWPQPCVTSTLRPRGKRPSSSKRLTVLPRTRRRVCDEHPGPSTYFGGSSGPHDHGRRCVPTGDPGYSSVDAPTREGGSGDDRTPHWSRLDR